MSSLFRLVASLLVLLALTITPSMVLAQRLDRGQLAAIANELEADDMTRRRDALASLEALAVEADSLRNSLPPALETPTIQSRIQAIDELGEFFSRSVPVSSMLTEIILDDERELRWMAASVLEPQVLLFIDTYPALVAVYTSDDEALAGAAQALVQAADVGFLHNLFLAWGSIALDESWRLEILESAFESLEESLALHTGNFLEERQDDPARVLMNLASQLESFIIQSRSDLAPFIQALRDERPRTVITGPGLAISTNLVPFDYDALRSALRDADLQGTRLEVVIESYTSSGTDMNVLLSALITTMADEDYLVQEMSKRVFEAAPPGVVTDAHLQQMAMLLLQSNLVDYYFITNYLNLRNYQYNNLADVLSTDLQSDETGNQQKIAILDAIARIDIQLDGVIASIVPFLDSNDPDLKAAALSALISQSGSTSRFLDSNSAVASEIVPMLQQEFFDNPYNPLLARFLSAMAEVGADTLLVLLAKLGTLPDDLQADDLQKIAGLVQDSYLLEDIEPEQVTTLKDVVISNLESGDALRFDASAELLVAMAEQNRLIADDIRSLFANDSEETRTLAIRAAISSRELASTLLDELLTELENSERPDLDLNFDYRFSNIEIEDNRISTRLANLVNTGTYEQAVVASRSLLGLTLEDPRAFSIINNVIADADHPNREHAIYALGGVGLSNPNLAIDTLLTLLEEDEYLNLGLSALSILLGNIEIDENIRGRVAGSMSALMDTGLDSTIFSILTRTGSSDPALFERLKQEARNDAWYLDMVLQALTTTANTPAEPPGPAWRLETADIVYANINRVSNPAPLLATLPRKGEEELNNKVIDYLFAMLRQEDEYSKWQTTFELISLIPEHPAIASQLLNYIQNPANSDVDNVLENSISILAELPVDSLELMANGLVDIAIASNDRTRNDIAYLLTEMGSAGLPYLNRLARWEAETKSWNDIRFNMGIYSNFVFLLLGELNNSLSLEELQTRIDGLQAFKETVLDLEEKGRNETQLQFASSVNLDETSQQIESVIQAHRNQLRVSQLLSIEYWYEKIAANPYVLGILVYLLFPLAWALIWLARPGMLVPLELTLQQMNTRISFVSGTVSYLLLLTPFASTDRVLDAWLARHLRQATESFTSKETVSRRKNYYPLPLKVDDQILTDSPLDKLRDYLRVTFAQKEARILIRGEGGAGKTSLACQVAKWQLSSRASDRITRHFMIPILIETEFKNLRDAIGAQLKSLLKLGSPPAGKLLDRLLERQRILVIVDHYSELSEDSQKELKAALQSHNINALIVTSRVDVPELPETTRCTIVPQRIETGSLLVFLLNYLDQSELDIEIPEGSEINRQALHYISSSTQYRAADHLERMVEKEPVTALLAKMFADELIAAIKIENGIPREMTELPNMSTSITELMTRYINSLHRDSDPVQIQDMQYQLRTIAWLCVEPTLTPGETPYTMVKKELGYEDQDEKFSRLLEYYVNDLGVLTYVTEDKLLIRFQFDTLAEYLSVLHITEKFGEDELTWSKLLTRASQEIKNSPQVQWSFLGALSNCLSKHGATYRVPGPVVARVNEMVKGRQQQAA